MEFSGTMQRPIAKSEATELDPSVNLKYQNSATDPELHAVSKCNH